jgi:release factor glutamine methyltransferase
MTPADLCRSLARSLRPRYGPGEAASIARIVAEDVFLLKKHPARPLTAEQIAHLQQIQSRLTAGEPLQYVLGEADFFGLKFRVSSAVLIPRQETEELVAWVLEWLKTSEIERPALLDIGLGSGCIGIALKKNFPRLHLFGLEKSPAALAIALENAERLLTPRPSPLTFYEGDILDPADWERFPLLDVAVSNPPYIPLREKSLMPEHVLAHEPSLALFVDDADPLLFYRAIALFCQKKLRPGGALFFECNEFNAHQVADLLSEEDFAAVELRRDLAGAERMLKAVRKGEATGRFALAKG